MIASNEKYENRKKERSLLNEFCQLIWNSHGINNINPGSWELIQQELIRFFTSKKQEPDLEILKNRFPLVMIIKGPNQIEDAKLWDEYWRWENSSYNRIKYLREELCGIGSRLVKSRLNKLAKISADAKILRNLLELEDSANCESRYFGSYLERAKAKRREIVLEGQSLCKRFPGMIECGTFGNGMVFFTLTNDNQQFSWKFDEDWANAEFEKVDLSTYSLKIYDEDQLSRLEKLILPKITQK